ncbi:hypothetical protein [Lentzea flava]|uniref:Uncharacterized protein n=1 Tax=Lentzea flava TaxID=103732 RepID=A0ABQ2UNY8_9PSEU|nr:hypothetical protein [Lentzea flava]MCP2200929.1 hypothetical protein [Lentzea flava]GGU47010.1 hypothetical protein GCM10010178_44370 [Lentzea flava]
MSYPIFIPPSEPEPRWVWVSARRTMEIRSVGRRLGVSLLLCALLATALVVVLTLKLVGTDQWKGWGAAGVAGLVYVGFPVMSSLSVWVSSLDYVEGEYLNAVGAQMTRRVLGVAWGFSIFLTLPTLVVFIEAATRLPLPLAILPRCWR